MVGTLVDVGLGRRHAGDSPALSGLAIAPGPDRWPRRTGCAYGRWVINAGLPFAGAPFAGVRAHLVSSPGSLRAVYPSFPSVRGPFPVRTHSTTSAEITRAWHVIDADGLVLGRLCTEVARILRGKHKPIFAPHIDTGDHVIIVNADKIVLTSARRDEEDRLPPLGLSRRHQPRDATPTCSPGSPPRPCAARSGACCPRAPSAARCSEAQGVRRPRPTPTPPSSRSRSSSRTLASRALTQEFDSCPSRSSRSTGRRKRAVARVRLRPGTRHRSRSTAAPSRTTSRRRPTA